jgi:hypothetical protein
MPHLLKFIGLLKWHGMITRNLDAVPVLRSHYKQTQNAIALDRLDMLEGENADIALEFYKQARISSENRAKLGRIHDEIKARFSASYPQKDFDKTFGPSGVRDPDLKK